MEKEVEDITKNIIKQKEAEENQIVASVNPLLEFHNTIYRFGRLYYEMQLKP